MISPLAPVLLRLHRAAADADSLRTLLDSCARGLREGLQVPWVLALVREPVTAHVRSSVVDGLDSGPAALLLRRAARISDDDLVPGRVSVTPANPLGDVVAVTGSEYAALAPLRDDAGEPIGLVLIGLEESQELSVADLEQIAETICCEVLRATREEASRRRAHYDPITGLPSASLLDAALETAPADCEVALLLVSVDQLQSVTRSLGRAAGNEMLRKVALRLLVSGEAGASQVFRLTRGFGVLTIGAPGTARAAADRVMGTLAAPWQLGRRSVRSTCRIGVATRTAGMSTEQLVEQAETALDAALASPRAEVVVYGAELATQAHERLVLETLLQAALRSGELRVCYQPQVDVATGQVTGAEALVRWRRPSGMVTPDRFIPAAEATGVIVDIDRWVLGAACRQAQRWVTEGRPPLRIAVNISSRTLASPGFAATVIAELEQSGLAPDQLEVEITETLSLFQGDEAVRELSVLRRHGVHVAIDDFGTGYSNVGRLRELPVDRVKIDQSFVRDIAGADGGAICSVIVGLARTLQLDVIAEGVETPEQLAILGELGCSEFQGYLVSPPVEADEFTKVLARTDAAAASSPS